MKNIFFVSTYIILIFLFISCTNPQEPKENNDYGPLIGAASETSMNFSSSEISRPLGIFVEVPEEFWAQEIKDENPIRVYWHNINIALVFIETEKTEQGLYICVPISSYAPLNNDNVQYTVITGGVFNFVKKR
ncbi:hypothetical protein JW824_14435 [bacterium]|nr:hypothetical protein [bacterium]